MTGFSMIVCIAGAAAVIVMMVIANNDALREQQRARRSPVYRRHFTPHHAPIVRRSRTYTGV